MKNTNILKESCPKNVILMKTKNNTFLHFYIKQFSASFFLATYDWFCADGSHMYQNEMNKNTNCYLHKRVFTCFLLS